MNKNTKLTLITLALILILAGFLRLYNINHLPPGLYPDEAMNGNNALEALSTGNFKVFYPENNGREGLFINIQAISIAIFGNQPWALRIVSAIFGILTILGIYLLVSELFRKNKKIALLSAFLLATSFWHINFSRIGFRAISSPFYLIWALYFLFMAVRVLKENYFYTDTDKCISVPNAKKVYFYAIISGLFFGLGFHSYIAYRDTPLLLIIPFIYWLYYEKKLKRQILKIFILFISFSFIAGLPLGIYFLKNPKDFFGRTSQVSIFSAANPIKELALNTIKTLAMFNYSGDQNWRHNYAGRPELFWPVGIIFLVGIGLGFYSLFRKNKITSPELAGSIEKLSFLVIFAWLALAALPIVVSDEGIPHALRAIIMVPPVFILAGFGGIWLYEFIKNKLNKKAYLITFNLLTCVILALLTFEAYNTYFNLWGKNPNIQGAFASDYVELGKELNNLPKDAPKYVVVEANGVEVRGIPMPSQTVMFITDTFTPEKQNVKNIHYVLPDKINEIPKGSYIFYLK